MSDDQCECEAKICDGNVKPTVFSFRDCELDEGRRQLRRAGAAVETEPQVLNLLFELVRHRQLVVARAELRERLWPKQQVSDSTINACVSRARSAIGETKGGDPIIKTFSRFGYRFIADVEVHDAHRGDRQSRAVTPLPASNQLFGRSTELRWVHDTLEHRAGAKLIFVSGEAGIGKTRLIEQSMQLGAAENRTVLWGHCDESREPLPLWPWAQILRGYAASQPADRVSASFGSEIVELARLVPSLSDQFPEKSFASPALDPDENRLRLYGAITSFLMRASELRPMVIVLDDLQWIDAASLLMLRTVARDLAAAELRVIGLFRCEEVGSSHDLAELVTGLERERAFAHLKLKGIDSAALYSLLSTAAATRASPALLAAIDEQSEGNPLIAVETLREAESGRIPGSPHTDGNLTIPIAEGVRNLFRRRLRAAGAECQRLLAFAALIGREFSFAQLERIATESTETDLLELLDQARSAGLICITSDERQFRFMHPMLRRVLEDEINPVRRGRLLAAIAAPER